MDILEYKVRILRQKYPRHILKEKIKREIESLLIVTQNN